MYAYIVQGVRQWNQLLMPARLVKASSSETRRALSNRDATVPLLPEASLTDALGGSEARWLGLEQETWTARHTEMEIINLSSMKPVEPI